MDTFLTLLNHLLPVAITAMFLLAVVAVYIGYPYLRYVMHLSDARTDKGIENLARYLARQTGGRAVKVDEEWRTFIPAAARLSEVHQARHKLVQAHRQSSR